MSQGRRGCEWPDGCNRGALREVDAGPIGHPGRRWLCLHHAGRVWNARKAANRAAGLCTCGALPTPGFKTCEPCRERDTDAHRRGRRLKAFARSCGLTLPREPGRRRAFFDAYRQAHGRSQRAARRAWNKLMHRRRGRWCYEDEAAVARVSVPWEGHRVTVQALCGLRGIRDVHGVPAEPAPRSAAIYWLRVHGAPDVPDWREAA